MNQTQIQYLMNLPYTDPGNAERLHVMIGSDWKFVPQINRWVHWNGKRWQEETNAVLRNVAVTAYRKLASAIRSLPQTLDQTEQKRRANVSKIGIPAPFQRRRELLAGLQRHRLCRV